MGTLNRGYSRGYSDKGEDQMQCLAGCHNKSGDWRAPRGVLRFELDRGVPLEPQNPYPSLRVILAKKGTHF